MQLEIPEIVEVVRGLSPSKTTFMDETKTIRGWIQARRKQTQLNLDLVREPSPENDIKILLIFLRDLLVRAMRGEAGERTFRALEYTIKDKSCLTRNNYEVALSNARYRWGIKSGVEVISDVVEYFARTSLWNWESYLEKATAEAENNFSSDPLLRIKNIGFKVRDLALTNFTPRYAAFDLHVARVPTRIGLLNWGFDLLIDPRLEMGSNPNNLKNYLFLQKLFLRLSTLSNKKYSPADLDCLFWHHGRAICGAKPKCHICPISAVCLTGRAISLHPGRLRNRLDTSAGPLLDTGPSGIL